jgi:pimeloyl-ACP methyl ester carboxylesterase
VLVSTGGLGREVSWILRALAAPGVEYLMPVIFPPGLGRAGDMVGRRLRRLGLRPGVLANEWRTYAALTERANRGPFVRTLRSVIDVGGQAINAHDRLYLASHLPTLIVWGRRDRVIPASHAIATHEAWAGSQLVIFERSGHFPHAEDPARFVDVVTNFLGATEPMHLDERQWRATLIAGRRDASTGG